jgi:catechol 2,3-dioxygenase-like lactoylglutathione lyase family enzyme
VHIQTDSLDVHVPDVNQISIVVGDLASGLRRYSTVFGIDAWRRYRLGGAIHTTPEGDPHEFTVNAALSADRTSDGVELWRGDCTEIELIEPVAGENLFTEFLEDHGEGVHHVACWDLDYEKTLERFREAGYDIRQRSQVFGISEYCYIDTRKELSGMVLEIARDAEEAKPTPADSDHVDDIFVTSQ